MDDDQQFCLRWNNHQSTLISVFDTLLENEVLVDCTLAAEGKFLKAHKVVLSACSPYFATLMEQQYDKHPIFILKDVKYQELRAMMDYMYRGEVNISQDQLTALLKAAESLQIKGLSDNRTGGSNMGGVSAPKPDHRGLSVPNATGGAGGVGKLSGGYTLEQTKRARIGPSSMDSQDLSGSREGSSSPSRRRRKVRRRSIENALTVQENSNSSQNQANQSSILQQQQQSNANITGVGAITAAATALASQLPVSAATLSSSTGAASGSISAAAVAGAGASTSSSAQGTNQQLTTSVTKKTESVKGTTTNDAINSENVQAIGVDEQDLDNIGKAIAADKQIHKQKLSNIAGKDTNELIIEPKSEYDDEGNDETVEDLTLDDEDMGMDDMDHNAGTSQGGEGSSHGYAGWQHDRSQDELLLATQEAQQRDPQDLKYEFQSTMTVHDDTLTERFPCAVCGKSYLRKRHLQRHMRDECIGIPPRFSCDLCPSRFRRKYHMVRHLTSKHSIPPAIAQQTTGSRHSSGGGGNSYNGGGGGGGDCGASIGSGSQNGCDSPIPENLSMRKDYYDNENIPASPRVPATDSGVVGCGIPPLTAMPTYGLTGAITAITAAAALVDDVNHKKMSNDIEADDDEDDAGSADAGTDGRDGGVIGADGVVKIKAEPVTPSKTMNMMDDDWKMKLSLQLISNSLLKERLMNSMPFAYNNN